MDGLILRIKDYLVKEYNCHMILLYGSYATGDFSDESDMDLICFTDEKGNFNDTSIFEGKQLDVWVYNTEELNKPEDYLHVITNRVVFDERNLANSFFGNIDKIYSRGPDKLDGNKKLFIRDWLKKMVRRTQRGDLEGAYRHHWLMKDCLEIYFELNGIWFLGVKKSLKWLYNNDIEVYKF